MARWIAVLMVLMFSALAAVPAMATDLPRVMIVGDDADHDTIPRNSRVFDRVLNAISNELLNEGFEVKDETALSSETHIQGRSRRTDAELVQIAKDLGIDVLVIFSIYPNVKKNQNSVRATARVEGRLLSVYDGSRMGNFEAEPQAYQPVDKPYARNDILEAVGRMSKILGQDVGQVLAQRLSNYVDQEGGRLQEWTLIFDGFSADEMAAVEDYLVIFSGYDSHRPKPNALNTSSHHEYLYRSSIDSAKLQSNLNKMLNKMNIKGRIYISGLEVKVVQQNGVRQRRVQKQSEW
ncbi:MAG: hypothetical protein AB7D07_11960 [Desulfovibrionaceae bacterium]